MDHPWLGSGRTMAARPSSCCLNAAWSSRFSAPSCGWAHGYRACGQSDGSRCSPSRLPSSNRRRRRRLNFGRCPKSHRIGSDVNRTVTPEVEWFQTVMMIPSWPSLARNRGAGTKTSASSTSSLCGQPAVAAATAISTTLPPCPPPRGVGRETCEFSSRGKGTSVLIL